MPSLISIRSSRLRLALHDAHLDQKVPLLVVGQGKILRSDPETKTLTRSPTLISDACTGLLLTCLISLSAYFPSVSFSFRLLLSKRLFRLAHAFQLGEFLHLLLYFTGRLSGVSEDLPRLFSGIGNHLFFFFARSAICSRSLPAFSSWQGC